MKAIKANPVAFAAALAALIEAILGILTVTEVIKPEISTPIMTAVAASVGLVKVVVTPVVKVAQVLDTTVEGANNILKGVKL